MHKTRITAGQRIVDILRAEGVSVLFGQGELSLKDIQKHALQQGMKLVGPRHEASGIWMASAYYRLTGVPQVAMGAQGPGAANMLPAAVWAAEEHIPVIIIGACRQQEVATGIRRGRFLFAESLFDCFAQICKFARQVTHPRQVDEVLHAAFREALSGTPGPVYVEVDYAGHTRLWEYGELLPPQRYRVLSQPAAASVVAEAAAMLHGSRNLLIIGGEEIHSTRTHEPFLRLVRLLKCPVITTFGGSGAIKQSDPQWLAYSSEAGRRAIESAQLVLAVGTCIPENINYGRQRHFAKGNDARKWIQIDPDPAAIGINRAIDLPVIGRLQDVLPQLCEALRARGERPPHPQLQSWRRAYEMERDAQWAAVQDSEPINPNRLMLEARAAVPDDAVIVSDSGFTIVYQHDCFEKRNNDFIWGSFFAHLGAGLPQAIGAQLACGRQRPVCLVCGDGGLGVHIMELETAVRHDLPIVIVLNDDRAFAAELQALQEHMGATPEALFADVRFDQLMVSMGGYGEYVDRTEDIQPAIRRAFASGKTAIVQVRTDQRSGLEYPPITGMELYSWVHEDVRAMDD